jgi:drug/metabolite transporter superfamily protein YnfA
MDSVIFPTLPTYAGAPTLGGLLSLAVTVLLPIIAALFMRSSWSAFRKGLVLFALAAIKAYLEAWLGAVNHDEAFNFVTAAYSTVVQFVLAVVAYIGLLKGTAVQQSAIAGGPVNDRTIDGHVV